MLFYFMVRNIAFHLFLKKVWSKVLSKSFITCLENGEVMSIDNRTSFPSSLAPHHLQDYVFCSMPTVEALSQVASQQYH